MRRGIIAAATLIVALALAASAQADRRATRGESAAINRLLHPLGCRASAIRVSTARTRDRYAVAKVTGHNCQSTGVALYAVRGRWRMQTVSIDEAPCTRKFPRAVVRDLTHFFPDLPRYC